MKAIIERLRIAAALAVLLALSFASTGWADFAKTNPVTDEAENYTWKFTGDNTWDGITYWRDSSGNTPSNVPGKSGDGAGWSPFLFEGPNANLNNVGMSVEGWNLRMGLYDGAYVNLNNLVKIQGDTAMWITVDETSQLQISTFKGGNLGNQDGGQPIRLYVARSAGINWSVACTTSGYEGNTFEYYLKGDGSVSYQALNAANHEIKQADVTLSGTSQVASKTLVSFTSTTKTFTADAAIKIKNSNGDVIVSKWVGTVNATGTSTLTTANPVGSVELVQTGTGIVLYYVDGDPADAAYKPSININFTNGAGNGLTTAADVGLAGYAVPGTSWNNFVVADNVTFNTVNAIDSMGVASVASGVSVQISGTRGSYQCSDLAPATNPLHGYIDENNNYSMPTVTITGIPYSNYRVIVYHSTNEGNKPFGYDTINSTNFTYVNGVQVIGTSSWGNSGGENNANPIAEGVNTLVSGILSGDTVTMVAHRFINGNYADARGCFAAIQVVEVAINENELLIPVSGDTTYTVSADKTYKKVIISGTGTLTLNGANTITTDVLEIEKNSAIVMNESRIAATTVVGEGTAVYSGIVPLTDKGWTDGAGWTGTLEIRDLDLGGQSTDANYMSNEALNACGNVKSTLRFCGVKGYMPQGSDINVPVELKDSTTANRAYGIDFSNGWAYNGSNAIKIKTLKGSGTLKGESAGTKQLVNIQNWDNFTGTVDASVQCFWFGSESTLPANSGSLTQSSIYLYGDMTLSASKKLYARGAVYVAEGCTVDLAANNGFIQGDQITIDGTIRAKSYGNAWGAVYNPAGATTINSTGVLQLQATGSDNGDYSNVTGTGTVKFQYVTNNNLGNWRAIPAPMFADTLSLVNEQADGLIFTNTVSTTIGSLSGTGVLRSDLNTSVTTRSVHIKQTVDGTWSGVFRKGDCIGTVYVEPGTSTSGTLTLAGDQVASNTANNESHDNNLQVESGASVNLTGTWKGATTVSGTFGGTGTLTGDLTFNDDATFKAFATDSDGLSVSGTVTLPASGTVTVDVSDITLSGSGITLMTFTDDNTPEDISALSCTVPLKIVDNKLVAYPKMVFVPTSGDPVACADVSAAISQIAMADGIYQYIEIFTSEAQTISLSMLSEINIKNTGGAALTFSGYGEDCNYETDTTTSNEYVIYKKTNKPTVYTWTGQVMIYNYEEAQHVADSRWSTKGNWTFENSESVTTTATRAPGSGDDVIFNAAASVTIVESVTVASVTNSAAVTFTKNSADTTLAATTGGIVLTDAAATLTVSGVTLSPTPTTTVVDSYVKLDGSTYSVAAKKTITLTTDANVTSVSGVTNGQKVAPGETFTVSAEVSQYYTASVSVTGATDDGNGTYTVGDSDVTVSVTATRDTYTITVPDVANTTVSVSYTSGGEALVATAAGNITVDAGTSLTATWTAVSGYRITAGASETINPVAAAATLARPTVAANSVTFSGYAVEYTADYSKAATISATVSGEGAEGATYSLTAGGNNYNGTYNAGTVTFSNVTAPSLGGELSYTISASGAASGTSGAQTETVGNVTSGWVQEDATHNKSTGTGTWETDVTYSEGVATITDNTYTPTKPGDGIVTLTTVVKFGDDADPEVAVGAAAQAALRVQNGKFEVYGKTTSEGAAGWQTTVVPADSETVYTVTLTINYPAKTFTASVQASGAGSPTQLGGTWYLATDADKVSQIAYKGTGEFTSLVGSFISSDIEVTVDTEDEVSVSGDFIRDYLGSKTVSEASVLLAPDSTTTASNGYNYFSNYALGLDPTDKDDKPTIKVETNSDGKFVVTLTDKEGNVLDIADNVAVTLSVKTGATPESVTDDGVAGEIVDGEGSAEGKSFVIDPSKVDSVKYYKVRIDIGAK